MVAAQVKDVNLLLSWVVLFVMLQAVHVINLVNLRDVMNALIVVGTAAKIVAKIVGKNAGKQVALAVVIIVIFVTATAKDVIAVNVTANCSIKQQ